MRLSTPFALVGLLLAGCTWYPYSPYSGGYYGGTYAPPGGYMTPGPTYVPQNYGPTLNTPGSPTPINPTTPSTTTPTTPNRPNWYTPSTPNGGSSTDAPPFQSNPPTNPVPLPRDDPFGAPPAAAATVRPPTLASRPPFPETAATTVQPAAGQSGDPFVEPARLPADSSAQPMPGESVPYAYDASGYKWLKGIVDFDDETKTWAIIFSLTPDKSDKFAGTLLLAPGDQLGVLKSGDLVLLAGYPHPTLSDSRGLPLYHVTKVTTLGRRTDR